MSSGDTRRAAARKRCAVLLAGSALSALALATPAAAQNATWLLNPATADFNDPANWTTGVPTGTAFFGQSNTTNLFFTLDTTLGGWTFNADASDYTFFLNVQELEFTGAGIAINGGSATINSILGVQFSNASTAGSATINSNGFLGFSGTSTAGNANITNDGLLEFSNTSTAGNANITNNDTVEFIDGSNAGNATISNTGFVTFSNTSKAGTATINNQFDLTFEDSASADRATINNTLAGVTFLGSSTAANSRINNDGGGVGFFDSSRAGNSTIRTFNGGLLLFFDDSNGDNARIIAEAGSFVEFSGATGVNGVFTVGSIEGAGDFDIGGEHQQFIVGGNNRSTAVSGTISECGCFPGILVKVGSGRLTLLGNNTYTGGTIIREGTIAAGNNNAMGTGTVTFDGGVLRAANNNLNFANSFAVNTAGGRIDTAGNTMTISGVIANGNGATGTLAKTGLGTLILIAQNTYTGATQISQGILQLGVADALSDATAVKISSGATFDLNGLDETIGSLAGAGNVTLGAATLTTGGDNATTTFSGTISGTGGLTKQGDGTFKLTGNNTYTGVTTIERGILQIGNGGTTGALGTGNIVNDGTLAVDRSNRFVIDNVISGTGAFQHNGSGVTVLTADNTFSGTTTVNNGVLVINGSNGNSAVIVNANGTLAGTGGVGGLALKGGVLSPGNSIGTFTVNGSLTMTAAATYLVEVSPSAADSTHVTGTAQLAGTVNAMFANGSYVRRDYTILSAGGGRTGTFDTLATTNLPAGFNSSLSYTATDVLLNLTAALGAKQGLAGNQQSVATALNTFFNDGGALPPAFFTVFGLTGAPLGNALTQLSGEHATGMQQAGIQSMNLFLNAMLDPFVAGRNGGFGAALGYAPEEAFAANFPVKAPRVASFDQRWSVWGAAYGGRNRTDGEPVVFGSHDTAVNAAGFAGGVDYRVSPNTVIGAALAIGENRWTVANLGKGNADVAQVGGYFSTRWNNAYVSAAVAGAWHDASTERTVTVVGIDRLRADFDARSIGARAEAGYRFDFGRYGLTPYAAVQIESLRTPNYAERATFGAGNFALTYAGQTTTDTRSELGAWADTRHRLDSGAQLLLRARAAWVHDYDPGRRINAAFQTLPGAAFTVDGAAAPKNATLTSAVAELKLRNGVTLIGKVDGEFSGRSTTYAGTGTLKYAW